MNQEADEFFKNVPRGHDLELRNKIAELEAEKVLKYLEKKEAEEQAEKIRELNDERLLLLGFIDDFKSRLDGMELPEMESMKYRSVIHQLSDTIVMIKSLKAHMKPSVPELIKDLNNSMK